MLKFLILCLIILVSSGSECQNNLVLLDGVCQCPTGQFLFNNTCTDQCPTKFFADPEHNQCVSCARGCNICTNQTAGGCTACNTGFSLINGMCTCEFPDIMYTAVDGQCPTDAAEVNYNVTHKQCISCSSSCPQGKYYDGLEGKCISCPDGCKSCIKTSTVECIECTDPLFYNMITKTCVAECKTFPSGVFCFPIKCSASQIYDPLVQDCTGSCSSGVPDVIDINYGGIEVCGTCSSMCMSASAGCITPGDDKACTTGCSAFSEVLRSKTHIWNLEISKNTLDCLDPTVIATMPNIFQLPTATRAGTYYYCSPECTSCLNNAYDCVGCSNGYEMYPDGSCRPLCVAPNVRIGDYCLINQTLANPPNNTQPPQVPFIPNITTTFPEAAKAASAVSKVASVAVSTFVLTTQFLNPAASFAATRTQSLNMILYLRYLNIDYPKDLANKFNDSDSSTYQINFDFPENLLTTDDMISAPYRYDRYGLSPLFLVNFWGNIITCAIIIGVTIPLAILVKKKFAFKNKYLRRGMGWLTDIFVWNYLISFCFSSISDAFFFIIVQYQSYPGPQGNVNTAGMVISCFLTIAIVIVAPIALIKKYKQIFHALKHNPVEKVSEKMAGVKILFEDFKHESRMQVYFMMIYGVRVILYTIFVATIPDDPIAAASIMAFLNGFMTIYMVYYRPFQSKVSNCEILFYEANLFIVNVMTAKMATCKSKGDCDTSTIDSLTQGILAINIILGIASMCFSVYSMLLSVFHVIKYFTHRRRLRITPGDTTKITFNQIPSEAELGQLNSNRDEMAKMHTETGTKLNVDTNNGLEQNEGRKENAKGGALPLVTENENLISSPDESPMNKLISNEENQMKIGAPEGNGK